MPENKIPEKYKDDPRVTIGGVEWAIPLLSGRRIIKFGSLASSLTQISAKLPEEEMTRLYEAIYIGVSQGLEPPMTFDQWLDDYPITFNEVIVALPVIAKQAGMEMTARNPSPGEIKAEPSVDKLSSTIGTS